MYKHRLKLIDLILLDQEYKAVIFIHFSFSGRKQQIKLPIKDFIVYVFFNFKWK